MSRVNISLYRSAIRQVWSDGVLTEEEEESLQNLRKSLNIPMEVHQQLLIENGEEIYKNALWWAWEDGVMEAHETEELEKLQGMLNISSEQHDRLEAIVRMEISKIEKEKPKTPEDHWSLEGVLPNMKIIEVTKEKDKEVTVPEGAEPLSWEEYLMVGSAMYQNDDLERAVAFFDRTLAENTNCGKAQFFRKKATFRLKSQGKEIPKKPGTEGAAETIYFKVPVSAEGKAEGTADVAAAKEAEAEAEVSLAAAAKPFSICISCGGKSNCAWCKGEGKCYWCLGSGQCKMCSGSGKSIGGRICSSCNGEGKCNSCKGQGSCYWCDGTGKCSKCSA